MVTAILGAVTALAGMAGNVIGGNKQSLNASKGAIRDGVLGAQNYSQQQSDAINTRNLIIALIAVGLIAFVGFSLYKNK